MNVKAYLAEFVGTFALVFIAVGAIVADLMSEGAAGLTGIALANGLVIAAMATATAAISGGHLNPAVTFGMLITGKISGKNAVGYAIAQCLGAIAGAAVLRAIVPTDALRAVGMGTPALADGIGVTAGVLTEAVLTFFLVFVIFGTAVDSRAPKAGGLYIGMAVTIGIFMGGPITGAAMNPARHLGPALLGGGLSETWIYWVGPLLGSSAAALLYANVLEE